MGPHFFLHWQPSEESVISISKRVSSRAASKSHKQSREICFKSEVDLLRWLYFTFASKGLSRNSTYTTFFSQQMIMGNRYNNDFEPWAKRLIQVRRNIWEPARKTYFFTSNHPQACYNFLFARHGWHDGKIAGMFEGLRALKFGRNSSVNTYAETTCPCQNDLQVPPHLCLLSL